MQSWLLQGHAAGVKTVAWSPDSTLFASASIDNTVRIWSSAGECLAVLRGHKSPVYLMAWAPKGEVLVTVEPGSSAGSDDPAVLGLWDKNGNKISFCKTPPIRALEWAPSGEMFVTGSTDTGIRLWDRAGNQVQVLSGHTGSVYSLAWSKTGTLGSAQHDGKILLWDPDFTFLEIQERKGLGIITKLKWSADGSILAGFFEKRIVFWTNEGQRCGELKDIGAQFAHNEDVKEIQWAPQSNLLASIAWEDLIRIWNAKRECIKFMRAGKANSQMQRPIIPTSIAWSPDGTILAALYEDGILRFWDLEGDCIGTFLVDSLRTSSIAESSKRSSRWTNSIDYEGRIMMSPDGRTIAIWEPHNDSMIFLYWIKTKTSTLKTYLFNEVRPTETETQSKEHTCPICREAILDTEKVNRCHYCESLFHTKCILNWVVDEAHIVCPHCNNVFIIS